MTPADLDIVARTIWGEARGESLEGKIAVGWIIRNRADNPKWWSRNPDDIPDDTPAAVCRDPAQFSCWLESDPNRAKLLAVTVTDAAFRECLMVTAGVLSGNMADPTGGANHYHAMSVAPRWAVGRQPDARVGNHLFYKI